MHTGLPESRTTTWFDFLNGHTVIFLKLLGYLNKSTILLLALASSWLHVF